MKLFKSAAFYLLVLTVIVSFFTQEVEARRKVLQGRKTLTRTYLRDNAIPAWAIVILVGVGEIILGGIMYLVMKKLVLDAALTGGYAVTNTAEA